VYICKKDVCPIRGMKARVLSAIE